LNDQHLENKVSQDVDKVRKDLSTLLEDGVFQLSRFEDNVNPTTDKVKGDLTTRVEEGISQLSKGFEKLRGETRKTVVGAAATVKKDVGNGMSQFNDTAQKIADKVLGGFGKKATRYPWVAISTALAVGFLLGSLLKPTRKIMKFLK